MWRTKQIFMLFAYSIKILFFKKYILYASLTERNSLREAIKTRSEEYETESCYHFKKWTQNDKELNQF